MRLDRSLVARGLVSTRSRAQDLIVRGMVSVDGAIETKPARSVDGAKAIAIAPGAGRFASRAGEKLEAALPIFGIEVSGRRAIDIGASTGGFTDCLLQRGAVEITAVDVGTDQLVERLREDHRVTSLEGTDVRSLDPAQIGAPFDLVVVDLSFIGLAHVLDSVMALGSRNTDYVMLVKPQFEVGRDHLDRKGVVTSEDARRRALARVVEQCQSRGLVFAGCVVSATRGGAGNTEYLVRMTPDRVLASLVPTGHDGRHHD